MSKLIITIESEDSTIAELLKKHRFDADYELEIIAKSTYKYIAPKTKPYFTCPLVLGVTFNFEFQGINKISKVEEFDALKNFSEAYTTFAKKILAEQVCFQDKFSAENLSKNGVLLNIYNNLMDEEHKKWIRLDPTSPQFFITKPEVPYTSYNLHEGNFKIDKSAQYCLMAGLGLCLASGILYLLTPAAVAIAAFVLGIGLIGFAAYRHQKLNASLQQEEAIELLPCAL